MDADELSRELDMHDALVICCARGVMDYERFEKEYKAFFMRCALDGHEGGPAEVKALEQFSYRIDIHRKIWDRVLTRATSEQLATTPEAQRAGYLSPLEAQAVLRQIAIEAGLLKDAG